MGDVYEMDKDDIEEHNIIGFVGHDIDNVWEYIVEENVWKHINKNRYSFFEKNFAILNNENLKIVEYEQNVKDKRMLTHGAICQNLNIKKIKEYCEIMQIDVKQNDRVELCASISEQLLMREFNYRLNCNNKKVLIFDFEGTFKLH